jgi:HYR domain
MIFPVFTSNLADVARPASRLGCPRLLPALFAGMLLFNTHSAVAALNFGRGTPTTVGCIRFANSPDSVTITAALTAPGTITSGLAIPANRIQYDIINCDLGPMYSWTVYYSPVVGPDIIGAYTPLGYIDFTGVIVPQGGYAYTTLFNAGFGIYNYNTGAPWIIDYEPDHITFTTTASPPGLLANDGVGFLNPTPYLPSFAILFSPNLANGLVPASATIGTVTMNGQVYGPLQGNPCLSIQCSNIVVETCSNCVPVAFSATALDPCCSNATLIYQPQSGTCFAVNTTTTVTVIGSDNCGNVATNYFTVTVNPGPDCKPTNCISIYTSNIVAHTCAPCTPVAYSTYAVDNCCPGVAPTLIFNPPPGTCFPQNSSTTVHVIAYDQCGNTNTGTFTVTVLPGPDCGNTNCISINASNIVAYTCSPCTKVPFIVTVSDQCCTSGGITVSYNPPTNTCFPLNSTTTVKIKASDACGNTATKFITVTVLPGPNCNPTNCVTIYASNIVVYTCSNCTTVPYTASVLDTCCAAGATLSFNPPETYCFPLNSTTTVNVSASDPCGNGAVNSFTVTVLPGPNCAPTNCISLYTTNIVVYTCSNCVTVPFNAFAYDSCCPGSPSPTIIFNPPATTCFPLNSTTPVEADAFDSCGNGATNFFLVTVLPGPNCGGSNPLSITGGTGPGAGGTNYITVSWPATNAQLLESADMIEWHPVPGATSPYVVPIQRQMKFYRLQYK